MHKTVADIHVGSTPSVGLRSTVYVITWAHVYIAWNCLLVRRLLGIVGLWYFLLLRHWLHKRTGPKAQNRQTLSGNRMWHNFLFLFVCHWAYASIAHAIGTARIVAYAEQGLCNGTMSIRLSVCLSAWKNFKNRSTFSDVAERAYRIVFVDSQCIVFSRATLC